jgi:hypothetical protein
MATGPAIEKLGDLLKLTEVHLWLLVPPSPLSSFIILISLGFYALLVLLLPLIWWRSCYLLLSFHFEKCRVLLLLSRNSVRTNLVAPSVQRLFPVLFLSMNRRASLFVSIFADNKSISWNRTYHTYPSPTLYPILARLHFFRLF